MTAGRSFSLLLLVALALLFWKGQFLAAASMDLPREVADYRTWSALIKEPHPVPLEFWIRCSAPTPENWADAYRAHGVHTERYIKVYGNTIGARAAPVTVHRRFPDGSVLVKEKLLTAEATSPEGVAFMVKRSGARFRDTGGWEFLYFPARGEAREIHKYCAACHQTAADRDYVFGLYPQ
jgi:hypothetical protein